GSGLQWCPSSPEYDGKRRGKGVRPRYLVRWTRPDKHAGTLAISGWYRLRQIASRQGHGGVCGIAYSQIGLRRKAWCRWPRFASVLWTLTWYTAGSTVQTPNPSSPRNQTCHLPLAHLPQPWYKKLRREQCVASRAGLCNSRRRPASEY